MTKQKKMGRLLDEDDVVDWLLKITEMYDGTGHFVDENVVKKNIESQIAKIPSAQPEIIYCRECKYKMLDTSGDEWICSHPSNNAWRITANHYCGYAERREE